MPHQHIDSISLFFTSSIYQILNNMPDYDNMNDRRDVAAPDMEAAERFNQAALVNGWPLLCDPYCHFTDTRLRKAVALWFDKADGHIPRRRDMTVRVLQPFISQLSLYERQPQPDGTTRWKVRLMGTEVALTTAEMTGKYIDEVIKPEFLPRWDLCGETVLRHGRPLRFLRRTDSFGKKYLVSEDFAAPLLNDKGQTEINMSISSFENFDPWEIVEERARQELNHSCCPP
jgi:hypothetical protein